jgi:hypothetical protein
VTTASILGVYRPRTSEEVQQVKAYAGLYHAGVMEIWDQEHLEAVMTGRKLGLVTVHRGLYSVGLGNFRHPSRALYLLPSVEEALPPEIAALGTQVKIETPTPYPIQPAAAGAILLHNRYLFRLRTPSMLLEVS